MIGQHREAEAVLLHRGQRHVGRVRGHGHQGGAGRLDVFHGALQGPQLQVAERAPLTPVEREDDRPRGEQIGKSDHPTRCVR